MKKVLTSRQIHEADIQTIKEEDIDSHELMERAAKAFVKIFCRYYNEDHPVFIFCGPGNNGGDGLAISRLLLKKNYTVQTRYLPSDNYSQDFRHNLERLLKLDGEKVRVIKDVEKLPPVPRHAIIIDALFGTGLNKPITGLAASLIEWMNEQNCVRVSVDVPTGLTDTGATPESATIISHRVITFQLPKQCLLLEDNSNYVDEFDIADIGLSEKAIAAQACDTFYTEVQDIKEKIKPVKRFHSKWSNGHALLIAGSYEKAGAAVLAATSCMRSGAGLLTIHIPRLAKDMINIALPEAMTEIDADDNVITSIAVSEKYSAYGIGPGLGMEELTVKAVKHFLKECNRPVVIDADALNIVAADKKILNHLTAEYILTPHVKEFDRLTHKHTTHYERIATQRLFSKEHQCIVVLKSAYTTISDTTGNIFFNSSGNAGLAKAGSGDVLLGIITSLLAQGYNTFDAAQCGVYIHGLAGDEAAMAKEKISMKAGDIIKYLPAAWKKLTA